MSTDTIFFAVIAFLLFAKLWSILGRRNEGDNNAPPRFNPFAPKPKGEADDDSPFRLEGGNRGATASAAQAATASMAGVPALPALRLAPDSLAGRLEQIKVLAPTFDEKAFLAEVRSVFTAILADFAKGDLTATAHRLGAHVLPSFQAAIAARKEAGQTLEHSMVRIKDIETTAAKIDGTRATITVRTVSEQKNILRDSSGQALPGQSGAVEEITDLWSFSRDIADPTTPWVLVETKS